MPENKKFIEWCEKLSEHCRNCNPEISPGEAADLLGKAAKLAAWCAKEERCRNISERLDGQDARISELEERISKLENRPENKKSTPKKSVSKKDVPDKNFDKFWAAYPKKVAKQRAHNAWEKIGANDELTEEIISALEMHKKSQQWLDDGGRFIPNPATWLNGRQWEDELFQGISGSDNKHSYDLEKLTKYAMEHTPTLKTER